MSNITRRVGFTTRNNITKDSTIRDSINIGVEEEDIGDIKY